MGVLINFPQKKRYDVKEILKDIKDKEDSLGAQMEKIKMHLGRINYLMQNKGKENT